MSMSARSWFDTSFFIFEMRLCQTVRGSPIFAEILFNFLGIRAKLATKYFLNDLVR